MPLTDQGPKETMASLEAGEPPWTASCRNIAHHQVVELPAVGECEVPPMVFLFGAGIIYLYFSLL
jgi:hypothetical protein